jgi:hypothetical protein
MKVSGLEPGNQAQKTHLRAPAISRHTEHSALRDTTEAHERAEYTRIHTPHNEQTSGKHPA